MVITTPKVDSAQMDCILQLGLTELDRVTGGGGRGKGPPFRITKRLGMSPLAL